MEQPKKHGLLRRALRWLGWTVLGIVVLVGAAIVYYRFDEALTPEAQAVLDMPVKLGEISDDNGYVAMVGMSAPPGEDQMAWGRKAIAALRAHDVPGYQKGPDWDPLMKNHIPFPQNGRWCVPGKDCAAAFKAKQAEVAKIVAQQDELLKRYRVVRAKPVYEEAYVPLRLESASPNLTALANGLHLTRFVVFSKVAAGDVAGALDEMEQEAAFHRRAIAGSRTLIGKLVAVRQLANDALVLSELMNAHRAALAPHAARIGRMLEGTEGMLDVRPALEVEMRNAAHLLRDPWAQGGQSWSAESLLYRPRMTINAMVAFEREKLAALGGDATGFDKAQEQSREIEKRWRTAGWLDYARNPVGALILGIGGFSYAQYVGRMHDTAALLRLVQAQAAVLASRARKPDDILKVLSAGGGKRFADPYTGKPFAVDAESGSIWFTARVRSGGWESEIARKSDLRVSVRP